MAKESLIRKSCVSELTDKGWIVSVPIRSRFGSVRLYWDNESKGCDDFFSIFDLIAWKGNKMRFIQYTALGNVSTRHKKIQKFIKKHQVSIPKNCTAEVWGYKDREGFVYKEKIEKLPD